MRIVVDDLRGPEIAQLLAEHLRCMYEVSPPESVHALDIDRLRQPHITFWSVWDGPELAGCGAVKELNPQHGEIKSMRTASAYLNRGVASLLMQHILAQAQQRGYSRLSLETGSQSYFEPARRLYRKFGFTECGPFEGYVEDIHSVFMTRAV